MAVKKRVFQVAREFSISNEALIEFLHKLNFDIRNHMSLLTDEAYAAVLDKYGEQPVAPKDEEQEFRKRLRDKRVHDEEKKKEVEAAIERRRQAADELVKERPILKQQRLEKAKADEIERERQVEVKKAGEVEPPVVEGEKQEPARRVKKKLKVIEIPVEEKGKRLREVDKPKSGSEAAKAEEFPVGSKIELPTEKPAEETEGGDKKRRRRKKRKKTGKDEEVATVEAKSKRPERKKKSRRKRPVFDEQEIQDTIKQTLAGIDETKAKRRKRRISADEYEEIEEVPVIKVSEFMSLAELANLMDVNPPELIRKCMDLGMLVTINQRLDMDTITLLASEYGFEIEALQDFAEDVLEEMQEEDREETLKARPPVVTIMGHVDHGKTSLLDHIRSSNIIAGEAGGITQHIGAYEVKVSSDGKAITFLDTPGHEAFTAMRARGAQATDIVVLVVAADDSVMPQTIEAISHAKAAGVPIVVAINKIDKPGANPDHIRQQLSTQGVLVEQWGGKYQAIEISAKTGQNIERLLEAILLEAELLDCKANPNRLARGVIIESKLDRGKGPVATVLVQNGTLKIGDPFVSGPNYGKVRSMFDERSRRVKIAGPSVPVQVLGFDTLPQAGDSFIVLESERDTKDISAKRQQLQREHDHWRSRPRTLDEFSRQIQKGQIRQLSLVIKADVDGSIQAIVDSLMKLSTEEVAVDVIHRGVGAISESDVLLASASEAIILGFNVRPTSKARELASKENVDIRQYDVIYDILNDIKAALEGFLSPEISEELIGTAEVRQVFKIPRIGTVAGCYVQSGKLNRNAGVKLYRDDRLIHDGKLASLKRFKDDAREVATGFECGLGFERFDDVKVGDIIEAYQVVETKRTLEQSKK
ncbi:translation initiation factor IF-2 [candidate division KSB1 bacterium]|nr:translation initiation factor IF-2 [candidate division KSB1 bacterium]